MRELEGLLISGGSAMKSLVQGLNRFRSEFFASHRELFQRLARGQHPEALFITCADSRINPNLITQTNPGELFILRNAGNIIPPYSSAHGGEGSTIEFAVVQLGIKDIIVCGHSHCGVVQALLHPDGLNDTPMLADWLAHAEAARRIAGEKYRGVDARVMENIVVQENVLLQLEHLRTHPSVALRLSRGELNLHGWVYKIETGEVFSYQPQEGQFMPLTEAPNLGELQKPVNQRSSQDFCKVDR